MSQPCLTGDQPTQISQLGIERRNSMTSLSASCQEQRSNLHNDDNAASFLRPANVMHFLLFSGIRLLRFKNRRRFNRRISFRAESVTRVLQRFSPRRFVSFVKCVSPASVIAVPSRFNAI